MKRYMAILLVLCFGIGIMTACQSSSVESTPRQQEEDTEQNLRPLGPGESNRGLSEKAELLAQEIYQNITYPEEILELNGRNVVINNAIIQAVDEERGYFITDNLLVFEYLRSFDAIVGHTISAAGILSYDLQAGGGLAKILNATIIDTTEGQTDDYEDQIPFETLREVATEIDWDVGIENNLNCVVSVPNVDFIDGGYGGSYEESWVSFATNAGGYIDGYYADICPYFIYFENGSLVISQASVPVFDSVDEDGLVDYRCDIIGIVRQKPNDTMPSPYDFYIENVYMYQVEGNSYEPSAWYEARSNGGDTYDEDGLTESDYVMLDRIFGGQYGDYTNAWWRRDPETYTFADMMAAFEDTYSEDTLCNLYAFLIEDCLLGK